MLPPKSVPRSSFKRLIMVGMGLWLQHSSNLLSWAESPASTYIIDNYDILNNL